MNHHIKNEKKSKLIIQEWEPGEFWVWLGIFWAGPYCSIEHAKLSTSLFGCNHVG